MAVSDRFITDAKKYIRVTSTAFDAEIADLIEAAKADLLLGGIDEEKANNEDDPLVKRAIMTYIKAGFGIDNPDAEKYSESYKMQKTNMMLSSDYSTAETAVPFTYSSEDE